MPRAAQRPHGPHLLENDDDRRDEPRRADVEGADDRDEPSEHENENTQRSTLRHRRDNPGDDEDDRPQREDGQEGKDARDEETARRGDAGPERLPDGGLLREIATRPRVDQRGALG